VENDDIFARFSRMRDELCGAVLTRVARMRRRHKIFIQV